MLENDLDIQGQFASEQQMRDEFGWTETLVFTTWSKTTWSKHQAFPNFFIAGKQSKWPQVTSYFQRHVSLGISTKKSLTINPPQGSKSMRSKKRHVDLRRLLWGLKGDATLISLAKTFPWVGLFWFYEETCFHPSRTDRYEKRPFTGLKSRWKWTRSSLAETFHTIIVFYWVQCFPLSPVPFFLQTLDCR